MKEYQLYQVDAFSSKIFGGNPAAVVPLQTWLPDATMQNLALENNLSETVFFVPSQKAGVDFDIRWFTPVDEVNLCGHATLASAYVLFQCLHWPNDKIVFEGKSGLLVCEKADTKISMDFPSWPPQTMETAPTGLLEALGIAHVISIQKSRDWLIELENEAAVKACQPNFSQLKQVADKVIITAAGSDCDFVSRFFAPALGVDEDPVTGSAHSQLIPFWAGKTGKTKFLAKQVSHRVGTLWCGLHGDRVSIAGEAALYLKGSFVLPAQ
jgi:PhzF family phenazine biosynthesis protein